MPGYTDPLCTVLDRRVHRVSFTSTLTHVNLPGMPLLPTSASRSPLLTKDNLDLSERRYCGAGGAIIKLPSRAGAVITNYGYGSLLPYFIKGLMKFYRNHHQSTEKALNSQKLIFIFQDI